LTLSVVITLSSFLNGSNFVLTKQKKQIVHSILKQGNGTCDEMSSLFKQRVTAESQHSKLHQLGWTSAQKEKQHSEHLIRLDQT
jgi:hypothetical protein